MVALRHEHIGTEHLLLGVLREADTLAARYLTQVGVNLDRARIATVAVLAGAPDLEAQSAE
jgi:ATP-dependent Clp protease ATP-binding subunit ClpA